jgi:hypothetical protein
MAVNRVLTEIDINDHLQDLLLKFQEYATVCRMIYAEDCSHPV